MCPTTVRHLRQFEVLRLRLSRFVDDRKAKREYISGSIVLAIVVEADGTKCHTYVVLGHAVFSPKVQTCVRCGACDTLAGDAGFTTAAPPPRMGLASAYLPRSAMGSWACGMRPSMSCDCA